MHEGINAMAYSKKVIRPRFLHVNHLFNNISVLIFQKKSQQQEHKQYQQQQQQTKQQQHQTKQTSREEDEYGFAAGGATALPPTSNGFHNPNQPEDSNDPDKWYMHDSMRPVGAPVHGGNCKCYRCQRKLTAI